MGKKYENHDWNALKAEYILSEWESVASFLKEKFGTKRALNGHYKKMTSGWAEEKRQIRRDALSCAKNEAFQQRVDAYESDMASAAEMHQEVMALLKSCLKYMFSEWTTIGADGELIANGKFNIRDLERVWKIIKTELSDLRDPKTPETFSEKRELSLEEMNLIESVLNDLGIKA